MWPCLWVLYSIPLVYKSVCVSVLCYFLLLWLYSIIWNQVLWYFQWCPCCWGFIWLSWVFCAYIWSLRFVLLFLWRMSLWFLLELHWICEAQVIKAQRQKLRFILKVRKTKEVTTGSYIYLSLHGNPISKNLRVRLTDSYLFLFYISLEFWV